jgi:hypothetical protein
VQGVAYALLQLVRLSAELGASEPLTQHVIVPHINFVAAFALEFLLSNDHNVVGLTLELLNAALLHYGALRATWRACVARCTALLCGQIFGFAIELGERDAPTLASLLLSPDKVRIGGARRVSTLFDKVSVKAAALSAFASLVLHLPRESLTCADAALSAAPRDRNDVGDVLMERLAPLFVHADPLVRANAASVCGNVVRGLLTRHIGALRDGERRAVLRALAALRRALGDASAVSLRQAVRAIGELLPAALDSEFAPQSVSLLRALLVDREQYWLVLTETLAVLSLVDYAVVHALEATLGESYELESRSNAAARRRATTTPTSTPTRRCTPQHRSRCSAPCCATCCGASATAMRACGAPPPTR